MLICEFQRVVCVDGLVLEAVNSYLLISFRRNTDTNTVKIIKYKMKSTKIPSSKNANPSESWRPRPPSQPTRAVPGIHGNIARSVNLRRKIGRDIRTRLIVTPAIKLDFENTIRDIVYPVKLSSILAAKTVF